MARRYRREKGPRPFMPLRRNGQFFSTWNALSDQERCRVVADIDRQALDRLAGMSPTLALGDGSSPADICSAVCAVVADPSTSGLVLNRLAMLLAEPALECIQQELGDQVERPSVEALQDAGEVAGAKYSFAAVRLVFAMAVEQGFAARREVRRVAASDERFAIAAAGTMPEIPLRPARQADDETRAQRRQRHREEAAARAERERQRREARPFESDDLQVSAHPVDSDDRDDAQESSLELMPVDRLVHPRLPKGARGDGDLVGRLATAFIRWGKGPDQGKRRPVVVIGASQRHLWVRPCYTRDYVAGGWRAVRIDDWASSGLSHEGFVALEVRRLPRNKVCVTEHRFTVHDWNRICRGEVHCE